LSSVVVIVARRHRRHRRIPSRLRYIKKWPLTEGAGWWMAERDDFKRGYWSRVEIPTRMQIFFLLIFVYKL
jgi:hypothetical protein